PRPLRRSPICFAVPKHARRREWFRPSRRVRGRIGRPLPLLHVRRQSTQAAAISLSSCGVPSENIMRKSLCSIASFKFPVLACKFPVPSQKFPVLLSREFHCKPLNLLAYRLSKLHLAGGFAKIPC